MKTYPLAYQNQQRQFNLQPKLKQQKQQQEQQLKTGLVQQYQQHKGKEQEQHKVCKEETDVTLAVGKAAWWTPALATNNNMRNLTFANALRDFLQNVSFHCYGKLVETGRRYQERLFWLIFHTTTLCTLIIFLWHNSSTGDQLLRETLHDQSYPIDKVPFPTVSICSINRISNASATRYATELNRKDPQHRGFDYFYEQIKMLKYNYYSPYEINEFHKAWTFQRFLDIYDREDAELFYDTRRRMAMLTPNCSDILLQCRIGRRYINCGVEFEEKFTSRGLCCTFNYNNKYSMVGALRGQLIRQSRGLTVLLRAPQSDNFYKMFSSDGFIIGIYSPLLHPDRSSGGIEENFALTGSDNYFSVTAEVHETVDEARFLSPKARNCLFTNEYPEWHGNEYTFNNCITLCRAHSIRVLCGCVPFYTPYDNITSIYEDTVYCTLQNKGCLARYDFKWFNVITERQYIHELQREIEDSLYCPHCLPSCSETQYSLRVSQLPLTKYNMKAFPDYRENHSDLALVHVYFAETESLYYKRLLVTSWFQMLSYIGNICGILTGFSIVGFCEVIFFLIRQIIRAYKNEILQDDNRVTNINQALIIAP